MPIQLNEEHGGKMLAVHVSGKLAAADYEHFVPEFERLVCKPFTKATVRYFDHAVADEARKWLGEA